ncbi:hypothetical protein D9M71_794620 [compost metagenome]
MQLPVGIADAHVIHVVEGDLPDPATGNGFCRPRPHPADTDDGHMGIAQALHPLKAIQARDTGKTWIF